MGSDGVGVKMQDPPPPTELAQLGPSALNEDPQDSLHTIVSNRPRPGLVERQTSRVQLLSAALSKHCCEAQRQAPERGLPAAPAVGGSRLSSWKPRVHVTRRDPDASVGRRLSLAFSSCASEPREMGLLK